MRNFYIDKMKTDANERMVKTDNEIEGKGAKALGKALKVNTVLQALDLGGSSQLSSSINCLNNRMICDQKKGMEYGILAQKR